LNRVTAIVQRQRLSKWRNAACLCFNLL